MNRLGFFLGLACVWLISFADLSTACEAFLECESVEIIRVGKGRRHLAGGLTETIYVAGVMVDAASCNLKEVHANCPLKSIVIRMGNTTWDLPKAAVSTGGNAFWVERSTSKEALNAAMSMCPDKVKSYLE